jgi:ubiquinone biosynthesis protein
MATTLGNILRLARAGIVLAQHGVRFVPAGTRAPFALHLARWATLPPIRPAPAPQRRV